LSYIRIRGLARCARIAATRPLGNQRPGYRPQEMHDGAGRPERDVWIDLLRVGSVAIVVLGHWLTTTVIWSNDYMGIENALSVVRSSHPVTWLIQVMPLMFFVGGFSNQRSYARHDGSYLPFLRTRYIRLLQPTLWFIAIWTAVAIGAEVSGMALPNLVDRAADLAALPFWFLGLYVFVVALAPPMLGLHRRFGWRVLAALALGAVLVDVGYHGLGIEHLGALNFGFVWLLAHQLGFFYADGTLLQVPRRTVAWVVAASLAGLIVLTTAGGYPVSMVGVPGDDRWNTNPPSFALIVLTLWLVGVALLLRPILLRLLSSRRAARFVTRANRRVLTAFLWHVSALAIAAAAMYPLGMPQPATGSGHWWVQRPLWIAVSFCVLVLLVALLGRFEAHPSPSIPAVYPSGAYAASAVAVVSIGLGVLGFGVTGFNRIADSLGEGVLGFNLNPLANLIHLGMGLLLLASVFGLKSDRWRIALVSVSAVYLAIGVTGLGNGLDTLGTNRETAALQLAIGVIGALLLAWSWRSRK